MIGRLSKSKSNGDNPEAVFDVTTGHIKQADSEILKLQPEHLESFQMKNLCAEEAVIIKIVFIDSNIDGLLLLRRNVYTDATAWSAAPTLFS